MTDISASTATDSVAREEPTERGAIAAKYLVAFFFVINVCIAVYMVTQFFVPKTYGNGLHAIYVTIVLTTTALLGLATGRLWTGRTREGTYLFFISLAVSLIGNLGFELLA